MRHSGGVVKPSAFRFAGHACDGSRDRSTFGNRRNWSMRNDVSKTKIEANPNSLRIPIYVIRSGKRGLTITCADSKHGFKIGTSPEQLEKFRAKIESLFVELVEKRASIL